jgi:hypothetical protein
MSGSDFAPKPTTLEELRTAISTVVDYFFPAEMDDYRATRSEMVDPTGHIFHMLVTLNNWVHGLEEIPDQVIEHWETSMLPIFSEDALDEEA